MLTCFLSVVWLTYTEGEEVKEGVSSGGRVLGIILCLGGALSRATISVSNRMLKGISIYTVMFFQSVVGFACAVPFAIFHGT